MCLGHRPQTPDEEEEEEEAESVEWSLELPNG
jgi:hypothetical protein